MARDLKESGSAGSRERMKRMVEKTKETRDDGQTVTKKTIDAFFEHDTDEIVEHYLPLIPRESVILMPEGKTASEQIETMPWLLEECARLGFRFSPRLHILAWENERGR